ncbi:hypothetical protein ACFWF9_21965 [Streptomyces roseolus]|uniref:hypothetical protein n=1 Tax=Streptomyces roseolus TaxID=67358 RepID=UPI003663296A
MTLLGAALTAALVGAFGLLTVAGSRPSTRRETSVRGVNPLSTPVLSALPDVPREADIEELRTALRYVEGTHVVHVTTDRSVFVVSYGGPVPVVGRIAVDRNEAVAWTRDALLREGIPATVTATDLLEVWGVAVVLPPVVTARAVHALTALVTSRRPDVLTALRLWAVMTQRGFSRPDSFSPEDGSIHDLWLSVHDVSLVLEALGFPACGEIDDPDELNSLACGLAEQLAVALGGQVTVLADAAPLAETDLRSDGVVISLLTFDQVDRLTAALQPQEHQ